MIIHGDNLEALKALPPEYEGKVDCIYIDPPYNTGNLERPTRADRRAMRRAAFLYRKRMAALDCGTTGR